MLLDKAYNNTAVNALWGSLTVPAVEVRNGGTLRIGGTGNTQIASTADVQLNSGGTLDLNGRSVSLHRLLGEGTVTNTTANTRGEVIVGVGGSTSYNFRFDGVVRDGAGQTSLVKQGSGVFTLGVVQTYTGETRIEAGTLELTRANQLSPLTVVNLNTGSGVWSLANFNQSVAMVLGSGSVTLGTASPDMSV